MNELPSEDTTESTMVNKDEKTEKDKDEESQNGAQQRDSKDKTPDHTQEGEESPHEHETRKGKAPPKKVLPKRAATRKAAKQYPCFIKLVLYVENIVLRYCVIALLPYCLSVLNDSCGIMCVAFMHCGV